MTTQESPDSLPFRIAIRHADETWTYTDGEPIPMVDADNPEGLMSAEQKLAKVREILNTVKRTDNEFFFHWAALVAIEMVLNDE